METTTELRRLLHQTANLQGETYNREKDYDLEWVCFVVRKMLVFICPSYITCQKLNLSSPPHAGIYVATGTSLSPVISASQRVSKITRSGLDKYAVTLFLPRCLILTVAIDHQHEMERTDQLSVLFR